MALPNSPVKPTPVATSKLLPTRFRVEHSVYEKKSSCWVTVEAEYQKYVAGYISSEDTNIVQFWEVRFLIFRRGLGLQFTP